MALAAAMRSTPAGSTDEVTALLVAEIRALREDMRRAPAARSSLSRADQSTLARLLPPIAGVLGSERFLVRDLFESDAAGLGLVLGGLNARQVGRLFRRGEGQAIDGYMIQRDGAELNAVLWRILKA